MGRELGKYHERDDGCRGTSSGSSPCLCQSPCEVPEKSQAKFLEEKGLIFITFLWYQEVLHDVISFTIL